MELQNTGSNPVYCTMGTSPTATTANGFLLPANGGSWLLHAYEGPNGVFYLAPGDSVACIASGGSSTVISCDY